MNFKNKMITSCKFSAVKIPGNECDIIPWLIITIYFTVILFLSIAWNVFHILWTSIRTMTSSVVTRDALLKYVSDDNAVSFSTRWLALRTCAVWRQRRVRGDVTGSDVGGDEPVELLQLSAEWTTVIEIHSYSYPKLPRETTGLFMWSLCPDISQGFILLETQCLACPVTDKNF